jgi:selenide, water dikinase
MQTSASPVVKDLVLVGGGHSHLAVLKRFGMRPLRGVRLTLIARDVHTPYSGMLPGYIAGHYGFDDCHIDLRPLVRFAGARLLHDEAIGLDLENRRVLCARHPPVAYDLVSLNIGSRPSAEAPGAAEHAIAVKPVDRFLERWQAIAQWIAATGAPGGFRFAVVGGGAGGVELTLATQYRLGRLLAEQGSRAQVEFHLVTDAPVILPTHNRGVRERFERVLRERGVRVHTASPVVQVLPRQLICADGLQLDADAILWVTHAAPAPWLAASGLTPDERGFVKVNEFLQSVSHPEVFAAGDTAGMTEHPRPKSGVFAVRQGRPLAENLRRALLGEALKGFVPQRKFLGLISTGNRYAVASRGNWSLEGDWVWRWKDRIDRRFMRSYTELPEMKSAASSPSVTPGVAGPEALREISALAMRCGGCGAKVGSSVLTRVLNGLAPLERSDVLVGLQHPDDAAVVEVPPGKVLVQTVDFFRDFLDDPFRFGAVAANHSLSDIFAMGAEPQTALALATVPYGVERKMEEDLRQLMAGALEVLNAAGAALVGGHTTEGPELAFGLAVNGLAEREALMSKSGMRPGDALVLTKALGTGTLFAADMRRKARGRWIEAAIDSMLLSNREAAVCLRRHGATACTDVTGFGLLGHLVEMTRASQVDAELDLPALPVLDGALESLGLGIFSSLQPQNLRLRRALHDLDAVASHERYPLIFDPQTSGGLLASVPAHRAQACVRELRRHGYPAAAVIGRVAARSERPEPIRLNVAPATAPVRPSRSGSTAGRGEGK